MSEGRREHYRLAGCALAFWCCAGAAIHAGFFHVDFAWGILRMLVGTAAGVAGGALGGLLGSCGHTCRVLGVQRHEAANRAAFYGAGVLFLLLLSVPPVHSGWRCVLNGLAAGSILGLIGGVLAHFLSPAERAFSTAVRMLRRGNQEGAQKAIREYLAHSWEDPLRAARLPAAEAFLAGRRDTLDVSFELEAAAQPAGRGTELQAGPEVLPDDVRRPPDAEGLRG